MIVWCDMCRQVLGITNHSQWAEAGALRACMAASAAAREQLQAAALGRLEAFAHVGITEQLDESIVSLAAARGMKLDGPAWRVRTTPAPPSTCSGLEGSYPLVTVVAMAEAEEGALLQLLAALFIVAMVPCERGSKVFCVVPGKTGPARVVVTVVTDIVSPAHDSGACFTQRTCSKVTPT